MCCRGQLCRRMHKTETGRSRATLKSVRTSVRRNLTAPTPERSKDKSVRKPRVKRKGTDPRTCDPLRLRLLSSLLLYAGNLLLTAIVLTFVLEGDDTILRLFANGVSCGGCQSCRGCLRVFLRCGLLTLVPSVWRLPAVFADNHSQLNLVDWVHSRFLLHHL